MAQRARGQGAWQLDRRTFLGAGLAVPAAVWLAACGGDDDGGGGLPGNTIIIPRFPPEAVVPGSVRLPISFSDGQTLLATGPETITASILADGGSRTVAEGITAARIQLDPQQTAFWAVRADIDTPGVYDLVIDGIDALQPFQVFDPAAVAVPKVGDPLPPFDTPTVDDARGVDPICTRAEGVCALHGVTLTEALAQGKPVAYLVSTPAHCQFGVCGPVLELLLDAHERYGDRVVMVHADVYADDTATTPAPAVRAYNMSWEPSLYVADATGTVVERLDITFSQDELDAALALAGA